MALLGHEIDLLVNLDPIDLPDICFTPVIDYKLVQVVHEAHPLAARAFAQPRDLLSEKLITVPVSVLPDWLVRKEESDPPIRAVGLGKRGINKSINLDVRRGEEGTACIAASLRLREKRG